MTVTHPIDTVTERPDHARSRSCYYWRCRILGASGYGLEPGWVPVVTGFSPSEPQATPEATPQLPRPLAAPFSGLFSPAYRSLFLPPL
jgi:hypothetical protein